jgi:hypothetical protein
VDPASAVAKALGYTAAPAPGQMAALQLTAQSTVALVNVACGTEGVVIMEVDVAGGATAPATTLCSKQEEVSPAGQDACTYTVASAAQPVTVAVAQVTAQALGKRVVSFGSQAEYDAVRASLTGSYASALLASGALAGLWVDAARSAYLPPGYTTPGAGEASLLAGASLALTNVPAANTVAAILLEACSEVDTTFGERTFAACWAALPHPPVRACVYDARMHAAVMVRVARAMPAWPERMCMDGTACRHLRPAAQA